MYSHLSISNYQQCCSNSRLSIITYYSLRCWFRIRLVRTVPIYMANLNNSSESQSTNQALFHVITVLLSSDWSNRPAITATAGKVNQPITALHYIITVSEASDWSPPAPNQIYPCSTVEKYSIMRSSLSSLTWTHIVKFIVNFFVIIYYYSVLISESSS